MEKPKREMSVLDGNSPGNGSTSLLLQPTLLPKADMSYYAKSLVFVPPSEL